MASKKTMELSVGIFMFIGLACLFILALQVSGLTYVFENKQYKVTAIFDNIGDLKIRAPVTISGVRIGQVSEIQLDPNTYQANVVLMLDSKFKDIPTDSTARILTQGLLGSNYISLDPGFDHHFLKNGDKLTSTRSALILENLIGQLLFKFSGQTSKDNEDQNTKADTHTKP